MIGYYVGEPPPLRGEFRINLSRKVLVEIGRRRFVGIGDVWQWVYSVVEFESGQTYELRERSLGPALSEMEVIAWSTTNP